MTEDAVRGFLRSAVREAVRLGAVSTLRDRHIRADEALEYAQQLVMPAVISAIEQAREEGYQDGRASRLAVAVP